MARFPRRSKLYWKIVKRRKPDTKSKGHVFPDLILHRRGSAGPNLLVIEAKKESERTPQNEAFDRLKLAAYQDELHYRVAAFIVFGTDENNPRNSNFRPDSSGPEPTDLPPKSSDPGAS
jgi:hypothetical protein